jgi:hypothetical protein
VFSFTSAKGEVMNEPQALANDASVSPTQTVVPPHGLEEIPRTLGDIYEYIRPGGTLDPGWHADFLVRADLPFPMRLSWDHATSVSQVTCHKLLPESFRSVFAKIQHGGLQQKLVSFGGCFAFRP